MTLAELRTEAGMTQAELAEKCNRARSFISKVECGDIDINNIALSTAYKLAQALGCSIEDLVDAEKTSKQYDCTRVVRCKDCIYKPYQDDEGNVWSAPEDAEDICPCICQDTWYSFIPNNNFFCANGKKVQ